jgi:hypothetical protein
MDEYNTGMDPELKKYFRKIASSFSWGAVWLLGIATLGIFFKLGIVTNGIRWYNIVFYLGLIASLYMLIRYYSRAWNSKTE